ncbi:HDOD domain-containing protein [Neisseriaceae bacterium TC5R-5]|nr:HDOD domain-containing protein [Neisseriaceae bacterium TC5R-5]
MLRNLLGGLANRQKKTLDTEVSSNSSDIAIEYATENAENIELTEHNPLDLPLALGFVSYQPVLDKQHRIVAYDFFIRQGKHNQTEGKQQEFDLLMLSTLHNINIFRLLAYRRAFIHISITTLTDPLLLSLPTESIIFVLKPSASQAIDQTQLQLLDKLRQKGMRFAIEPAAYDQHSLPEPLHDELLRRMDYMILDFAAPSSRVLAPLLDQLPKRYPNARWFARNIGTAEDLDVCLRGPGHERFALFHGLFVTAAPTPLEGGKVDSSQSRVLQIMRMLRNNANSQEIENQFKLDSVVLFKLLRFINSPIHALSRKVQTIEDTLLLLGRETLFKWLSMLLFTSRKDDGAAIALLEKSLIRAHFLEKLGHYRSNKVESEHLFLTGMFSLLDVLLGVPFPTVLDPLALAPPICEAVIENKGLFAPHLALSIAYEQGDDAEVTKLVRVLNFDLELVNHYYMDAVIWAQEILRNSEIHHDVSNV